MKERTIKIVVLAVVFIMAMIGFSLWINRGSADMTADMDAPTLPTISFIMGEKEKFAKTVLRYGGLWQRLVLVCCYMPLATWCILR